MLHNYGSLTVVCFWIAEIFSGGCFPRKAAKITSRGNCLLIYILHTVFQPPNDFKKIILILFPWINDKNN